MRKIALLSIILATVAHAAPAPDMSLKKWRDEKGIWHYGDSRPVSPNAATNSAAEAYQRGDYVMAFGEYMKWAKQGDPQAQTMIGLMYLRGQGVVKNQGDALE